MLDKITGKAAGASAIGITKFLGFESVGDFVKSLLGTQYIVLVTPASIIGGMSYFITKYIWDSPEAIYTLIALMVADWVTGIAKSISNNTFEAMRIFRIPIYFIVTHFLIGISWNMAKGNTLFGFLPGVVFIGFCSVYFISVIQNLVVLKLLPKELANLIEKRASLKAIFGKKDQEKK